MFLKFSYDYEAVFKGRPRNIILTGLYNGISNSYCCYLKLLLLNAIVNEAAVALFKQELD